MCAHERWKEAWRLVFESNGARMNYEVAGDSGRVLLLLHGWGGCINSWLPVIRDFQRECRVVAVDFPGFGESPEPSEGWSVTEYARLTADFIESLGEESIDLIAHSFGGRVALLLSTMIPDKIGRQILTGCAGLPSKKSASGKLSETAFHALSSVADNAFTRRVIGADRIARARDAMRGLFGSADYKNASPRMRETFQKVVSQDLTDCLPLVKASTLLIWGENDTATPLWMGRKMEETIPGAGLVVFEGAGHFAYLEQYARFYAIAHKFLLG